MAKVGDESSKEHTPRATLAAALTSDETRAELKDRILSTIRGTGCKEWTVETLVAATNCNDYDEVEFCAHELVLDGHIPPSPCDVTPETSGQRKEREVVQKVRDRLEQHLRAPLRVVVVSSTASGSSSAPSPVSPTTSPPLDQKKPQLNRKPLVQQAAKALKVEKKITHGITSQRQFSRLLKEKIKECGGREYHEDYLRSLLGSDGVWPISKID